jgi:D-beta-D-heptose 7-phosphate kinase/D-beta-D-heptose 1-phosphate adenosyltransferase
MSHLLHKLGAWKPFNAIVVGDFMLDELVFGDVDRLCNDAPVPVLDVKKTEQRPGGAANVCLDLVAMHGSVKAFGLTGSDESGVRLRSLLREQGIGASGLIEDPERPTTVKRSLIGLAQHRHAQKMFRMDYESRAPMPGASLDKLMHEFERALHGTHVVCIEDYNKGVCTPELCQRVIRLCREHNVQVFVDPAALSDYSRYRGCTTMTPNRAEAEKATGISLGDSARAEQYAPVAEKLLRELAMDASVITLDKSGALLLESDGEARAVPTQARRVYDVTGAGDMVLAALAAARANGIEWFDAVRFANAAAGLEVEEFGVVPIPLDRIHRDILERERDTRGKVRTLDELVVEVRALRGSNGAHKPRVVLANGCFDVLHAGHVSLLRRAAALGDYLIVAVNDDASVRKLKGAGRPIYPIEDRAQLLGELECVGAVVVFGEDTPEKIIHAVVPDVLVKGAQYELDKIPGAKFVIDRGGRVELLEVVPGRSTTTTVERIRGQ